ncbi:abortive infection family protein [Hyphomonas atlantica]|uniref:Abortive infection protein-like C-terminal domain-containing protein n=1 Tax=Hyphomonas atlantica TaxID=1280948 RepID=A0A059EAR1_9PROT|nr:abortive infection family protein [Hyphomonas atlantica]KCZ64695.1 hypothetical protein HY36_12680 [Hyphomonas atlantica]
MIENLRQWLASAIADEKSYNVPAFCVRLGLPPGEAEEAHRSKFRYAQQRLIGEPTDVVINAARELLLEKDHFELSEAVAKIEELGSAQVTSLTRRRLITLFDDAPLATELDHLDFLRQVWPLAEMSAGTDNGSGSMEDFLFQHTVRNDDMTNREILEALGMLECSKARLFAFLKAVTGPEAQMQERQADLVSKINTLLVHDGYRLTEAGKMSGSPIFTVCAALKGSPADAVIAHSLANFDPDQIAARWHTAMESREASPGRAITLARTLLEDVCKWIIVEAGENYKESDDLPGLYRQLSKLLNLAPDNHTEQVFKQILGSCQSVVESLGALRNKLGDAHSLGPLRARPLPRHAALAVTLAGGMATFLVETWQARKTENGKTMS